MQVASRYAAVVAAPPTFVLAHRRQGVSCESSTRSSMQSGDTDAPVKFSGWPGAGPRPPRCGLGVDHRRLALRKAALGSGS